MQTITFYLNICYCLRDFIKINIRIFVYNRPVIEKEFYPSQSAYSI